VSETQGRTIPISLGEAATLCGEHSRVVSIRSLLGGRPSFRHPPSRRSLRLHESEGVPFQSPAAPPRPLCPSPPRPPSLGPSTPRFVSSSSSSNADQEPPRSRESKKPKPACSHFRKATACAPGRSSGDAPGRLTNYERWSQHTCTYDSKHGTCTCNGSRRQRTRQPPAVLVKVVVNWHRHHRSRSERAGSSPCRNNSCCVCRDHSRERTACGTENAKPDGLQPVPSSKDEVRRPCHRPLQTLSRRQCAVHL